MAKGTYHRVRDGEDLLFLAEWYYGDSAAWTHIYYANLDVYGDDFEMIPANNRVFIPDLETSDYVEVYTGPTPLLQRPLRISATRGWFRIETEGGGRKTIVLVFEGEGQQAE